MKKVTLKLFEFYQLENELVGISNSQTGEVLLEGIFGLYTSLATKYWLYDLYKKVAAEKELIEVLKK
jgi:dethiobiotin synthetase